MGSRKQAVRFGTSEDGSELIPSFGKETWREFFYSFSLHAANITERRTTAP
jgi:hypothetical protein